MKLSTATIGACLALGSALAITAHAGPTDWATQEQDPGGQRYSRAAQITVSNVGKLKEVWVYHLQTEAARAGRAGSAAPAAGGGRGAVPAVGAAGNAVGGRAAGAGGGRGGNGAAGAPPGLRLSESVPLVIGDTMYLGSPYSQVLALDPTNGAKKWVFDLPDGDSPSPRGISYWPGAKGTPPAIVFGSRLGRLYSISAATGTLNASFGEGGIVNLKTPEVMDAAAANGSLTLPNQPIIYRNLVITGAGPGEGPGGVDARKGVRGDTRAWDAATGKLVWTFHTVPRPGEPGFETWGGDSAKDRSGVNVWGAFTLDTQRGILYMPLGAPNSDRQGADRPGDNLYGSSIVAVEAATGKYLWHFQVVHHDIWDYDTQSQPLLFDMVKDGKTIPAVAVVNKNALLFFLNRVTGKPIYPVEERPVPASDVPGDQTSPTQPFPVITPALSQNSVTRDNLYKGVPSHQSYCEHLVDDNNMYLSPEPYTPPKVDRYTVNFPGTQGGVNFWGPTYDPKQGILVANVNNLAQPMRMVKNADGVYVNSGPLAGTRRFWDADNHLPCGPTPWGELVGVDVNTGKIAWRTTLGVTDSFPEGFKDTGRPGSGGAITTAGGLTFVAATDDARFRAFETKTGKLLWETKLPASGYANPITYEVKGKQYVAIVATGGSQIGAPLLSDGLHVFALP